MPKKISEKWEKIFDKKFWYLDREPEARHTEDCRCCSGNRGKVKDFISALILQKQKETIGGVIKIIDDYFDGVIAMPLPQKSKEQLKKIICQKQQKNK